MQPFSGFVSVLFGDEFVELNYGTAQQVIINASSRYFQGLPALLSIMTSQSDVLSRHKDSYNTSGRNGDTGKK